VHQWKYKEGEREEEMKERRKIEREEEEEEEISSPFNRVLHPPLSTSTSRVCRRGSDVSLDGFARGARSARGTHLAAATHVGQ